MYSWYDGEVRDLQSGGLRQQRDDMMGKIERRRNLMMKEVSIGEGNFFFQDSMIIYSYSDGQLDGLHIFSGLKNKFISNYKLRRSHLSTNFGDFLKRMLR